MRRHVTYRMLAAIHGAQEIHVHHVLDPGRIFLARIGQVEDARVVHEAIEPAECIQGGLDDRTR